jgi:phosphomannomutase/phosphoglucomutase
MALTKGFINSLGQQKGLLPKAGLPVVIGVGVVLVLAGGFFGYRWYSGYAEKGEAHRSESVAKWLGRDAVSAVSAALEPLDSAIDSAALGALLRGGDADAISAAEETLAATSDAVIRVRILKPGHSETDYETAPPLSYASLDLLRRSEQDGEAPPVEVHLKGDKDENIAVARRLEDAEGVLFGHVLVALRLKVLDSAVAQAQVPTGYVELQQPVTKGRPVVLGKRGDASMRGPQPTVTLAVAGTAWRAVYWAEATETEPAADAGGGLPVVPIALGLAILLAGAGGFVVIRRRRAPAVAPSAAGKPRAAATSSDEDLGPPPPIEVEEAPAVPVKVAAPEPTVELPESIFRAYDIRGVVGKSLSAEIVTAIGRAIGSEADSVGQKSVVVGRDGRNSSADLSVALVKGLRATGREVIDVGRVPTPLVYFATHYLGSGSGVMVTGSHNPPEYNGLKIMLDGETLFGDRITALRTRAQAGDFVSGSGDFQSMEVTSEYIRRVSEDVPVALGNAFKVVIDCGNGVAGEVAPQLIRALGHDVVELYCEVDGNFPNHHPDPSNLANLTDLVQAVRENEADIGFAFDGDGDRLGVVDGEGAIIFPDRQLMLFAEDVLSRNPGAEIIFDVKCSSRLPKFIEELGGKPVMWKTGHSFIKSKLKETGAPLAGEMSGHIFFKERWYGFDDALYAAARMLEILMGANQPPAEVFKKLPTGIATPELRVDLEEGEHLALLEKFTSSADFGDATVTTIDGVRVDYPDAWGLVRASNTTPSLVLRFEADDKEGLNRIGKLFKDQLLGIDPNLKLPF